MAGCSGGGSSGGGSSGGGSSSQSNAINASASLMQGVIVLDSQTASQIVTSDNTSIVFNGTLSGIKPGDVFIVQNTARKVESILYANGRTVIQTIEPELSEVFQTLDISGGTYIEEKHLNKAALPPNISVSVTPAESEQSRQISYSNVGNIFTFTITDEVIYDIDGDDNTTQDRILANGKVVLTKPYAYIDFNYGILKSSRYVEIQFTANESVNLQFSSQKLAFNKTVKIPLGEVYVPADAVGVPTGGTVGLSIPLFLVFNVNGTASVVVGVTQSLNLDVGLKANLSPLTLEPFNNTTNSFDFHLSQLDGELDASISINPDFLLKALNYSLAGLNNSMGVKATIKADALNLCLRAKTYATISSTAFVALPKASLDFDFSWEGFNLDMDFKMEQLYYDLFERSYLITEYGNNCTVVNTPPLAEAGVNNTANTKATVLLDGRGSYDNDGYIALYNWAQIGGTQVTLSNPNTATPFFIAPLAADTLTFKLTVTDDKGATAIDYVTVNVLAGNTNLSPIANAGIDQNVNAITTVFLNSTGSYDKDGVIVSYLWIQTGGTQQVVLTNPNTATPFFIAPLAADTLTFKLTVTDDKGTTAIDYVQIFVSSSTTNSTPVISSVVPNPNPPVNVGGTLSITCVASDLDGDALTYTWTSTGGNFSGSGSVVSWIAPSIAGTYLVNCSVSDGKGGNDSQGISISVVSSTTNTPPATPSNLVATALSQNNIALVWQDNSNNETGFKIERKTGATGTYSQITTVAAQAGSGSGVYYDNSGLIAGTTYCYRVRAYNTYDSSYLNENCATTQAPQNVPPTAITGSATNITSNSATLNGTVNPNGVATGAFFQYGTSTSFGYTTPSQVLGSATNNVNVTANLAGLSPNTVYYFRIVATNSLAETTFGMTQSFVTTSSAQVDRITNGSFSSGTSGWTLVGDFWAGTNLTRYRTSPGYASGGVDSTGSPKINVSGYMEQTITIPSGATSAALSFWLNITSDDNTTTQHDKLFVEVLNSSGAVLTTFAIYSNLDKGAACGTTCSYNQKSFNLTPYKGQTIRIRFRATTDGATDTVFRIDDVSLMSDGN